MKFQSIIWTYFLFLVLYLSGEESKMVEDVNYMSTQELAQKSVDSVYAALSNDQRLELLTIFPSQGDSADTENDSISVNNYLFNPSLTSLKQVSAKYFQNQPLHIASIQSFDSTSQARQIIGQTDMERLAFFAQAMELEKLKGKGANIVLGNYFQSLNKNWNNENFGFVESPLKSKKYWIQILQAGEANGIKIGLNDPFHKGRDIPSYKASEFSALGIAGNRYYSRNGHGIIQLSNDLEGYKTRLPQFTKVSRQAFLRAELDFDGIIISEDFSNHTKEEQISKAMKSILNGSDMVCISKENKNEILPFLNTYFNKNQEELRKSCTRILKLKYNIFNGSKNTTSFSQYDKPFEYQLKSAALTSLKNEDNLLPIKNLRDTILYFAANPDTTFFKDEIGHYSPHQLFIEKDANLNSICLLDGFGERIDEALRIATNYKGKVKYVLLTDANSLYRKRTANLSYLQGIIVASANTDLDRSMAIQSAFGAYDVNGKLPFFYTPNFKQGFGLEMKGLGRLSYVAPEYLGMNQETLDRIDQIAQNGVDAHAYPGCQVMFAHDGKVVYQKNFGYLDYNKTSHVTRETIYDIASISKIAASTASLMNLQSEGKFSLDSTLEALIPEVVGDNAMKNIWLKDMMAHQAGLPAWIPFYMKTLNHGDLKPYLYSSTMTGDFDVPVAKNIWINKAYKDTMYQRILSCSLGSKSYKYSDLGYYFVKKIIEKQGGLAMEHFVEKKIYSKLGLQTMTFNAYQKFDLSRIAPTEYDKIFRKQLVHGYVHDPGSAMLGGVCGHAGIFSTANDLAVLMQMFLNKGSYGGVEIIKPEVIDEYTSVQFPGRNKRGAGFDKPNLNGTAATACSSANPDSYGHSGFTGTLTWADPTDKINYVFLSNRVNTNAENWKIVKMDIRTDIQTKIYQAVRDARNYNFLVSI